MTTWKDSYPDLDDCDEFAGRWNWCDHCGCPCIDCLSCGISSCTGGGCSVCAKEHPKLQEAIDEGKHPFVEKYKEYWDKRLKELAALRARDLKELNK